MLRLLSMGLFLIFQIVGVAFAHGLLHPVRRDEPPVYIYPIELNRSGITNEHVEKLLQVFRNEFSKDFAETPWSFEYSWSQPYVGAGSWFFEGKFHVMLWGGMVRAAAMNDGVLAAVLCHELGHKLGGEPLQKFPGIHLEWSSAEGQADHFAATVCLPRIYNRLKTEAAEFLKNPPEPAALSLCEGAADLGRCQWVATSGLDLIQFLQVYFDREVPLAIPGVRATETPSETLHTAYPSYQCRMQIYQDGARCEQGLSCTRARCWFVDVLAKDGTFSE